MNIKTKTLLDNKITNCPEELMINSLKEIVLSLCDNPELSFDKDNKESFTNTANILQNFYRIFLAQVYITESLPFNPLEFYAEFLKNHLESADTYEYQNYTNYNFRHTFNTQLTEFINKNTEPLTTENT